MKGVSATVMFKPRRNGDEVIAKFKLPPLISFAHYGG